MEELGDLVGSVDAGGLVIGFGDVLEARQEEHRVVADVAPDGHQGAGDHHHAGLRNPADVGPHSLVQDAVLAVEDPAPHHGDGGGGADHGQEEDGPESALALRVQQHGHQEGQEQAQGHGEDAEVNGVPSSPPEFRALEDVDVVLEAHELVVAKAQVFTEAGVQRLDEGPQVQHHQAENGGGHHDVGPVLLPLGGGG